jgi:hypothetical protein
MNAPKWPGPGESYGGHRLLGGPVGTVLPGPWDDAPRAQVAAPARPVWGVTRAPSATRAFDFGDPEPRGGWPAPGSPVSPPARPLPWPEPEARPPGRTPTRVGGPRLRHVVGYPAVLLAGMAIGVAAGGVPGVTT